MIQTVAIEDNAFEDAVCKMAAILAYTINNCLFVCLFHY